MKNIKKCEQFIGRTEGWLDPLCTCWKWGADC